MLSSRTDSPESFGDFHMTLIFLFTIEWPNQSVEPTGARHSGYDVTGNSTVLFFVVSHSQAPVAHFYRWTGAFRRGQGDLSLGACLTVSIISIMG